MQSKMKPGPEKKLKPRGLLVSVSMCKPAPQTSGARGANKSCIEIFTLMLLRQFK